MSSTLASRALWAALGVVALVALVLGVATWRASREGEAHLARADAAIRANDLRLAASEAAMAARFYVPLAPHVGGAYARLVHVARTAEVDGKEDVALFAWNLLRASARETAWLVQPHAAELDLADSNVARLLARAAPDDKARAALTKRLDERLREDRAARRPFVLALLLGLAMTCVGALMAFARGAGRAGFDAGRAKLPLAIAGVGLALYVLSGLAS